MPLAHALLDQEAAATPEVEKRFFSKVRLPNGTWKTTYPDRLDDLNERLLEFLPQGRDLQLMDVAVSSGISTAEWSAQLSANGIRHRIVAGDLVTDGWLTSSGAWFALLCDDRNLEPLLLEVGPISLPVRSERRSVRAARPLLVPLLRGIASLARRRDARGRESRLLAYGPISLVVAEARERAEIEVTQDDVTVPGRFHDRFDVVRAANLVQRAYFDEETLTLVIANLRDRVRVGGLLVLCQTVDGHGNQATIFLRESNQFVAVGSLGDGVEVRDLVLAP